MEDDTRSTEPFQTALPRLVASAGYTTKTGTVNWAAFAEELHGVHYETLRKALAGERRVTPLVIEAAARALDLAREHFAEYRLHQARIALDECAVGFDRAMTTLATIEGAGRREPLAA